LEELVVLEVWRAPADRFVRCYHRACFFRLPGRESDLPEPRRPRPGNSVVRSHFPLSGLGLTRIEHNSGGFLPPVHIPTFDVILASDAARDDLLALFEGTGVSITGLNCNGNPLHPNKVIGDKHAEDIRRSIRLASRLGHNRVVTMSGLPGEESGATRPSCIVNAWNSAALDVLDHQSFSGWWQTVDAFELVSTERKSQPGTFPGRASLMQGDVVALDINLEARSREG
jgi:hypothetical protein